MQNRFNTIDGETLMGSPLAPIRFVVQQFIPQGLHILAGAPKTGKSWLALWLCLQVAKGEDVWNFKTERGTTLYLCLEDSESRIQSRLFDITDDAPDSIHFTVASDTISGGLEWQIETFVNEHPGTNLIVIDTLQKVRQVSNDNAYANDYRDLGVLKSVADRLGIAILLIHHLRKQADDDPISMVSGTTGITGAVDGLYVIRRDSRRAFSAKLTATGRDIEDREFSLCFDRQSRLWNFVSDDSEEPFSFPADDALSEVIAYIKTEKTFTGTASELTEKIGSSIRPNVLAKKIVQNMAELSAMAIAVSSYRTGKRRELTLRYEPPVDDSNDGNDGTGIC